MGIISFLNIMQDKLERGFCMKKRIYKVLSLLLTFLIVFSAFASVLGTVTAVTEKVYYVKANGDDSKLGDNKTNAVKTVGKVIELATAEGLAEGDIVNVKVVGQDPVAWLATGNQLPEHAFKLVIDSNTASIVGTVGDGNAIVLGGDVEFKNIKVNFGSSFANITANGHNVSSGFKTQFEGTKEQSGFNIGNTNIDTTYSKPVSILVNIPIMKFGFGNIFGNTVYNEKLNVKYSDSEGTPAFSMSADDGTTTFNAAANLEINAASSFTFANTDKVVFGADGYLQIFNATAKEIATTDLAGIDTAKLWVINNKLGISSVFTATDVSGKFKVDTDNFFNIKAIDATNENNVVEPVEGYLTLPAGAWNLFAEKVPQKATYYAAAKGNGDGSSVNSPLGSLAAVVTKALADGYMAQDEVTVKVIGTEKLTLGNIPNHDFKLIVTSNTGKEATVGNQNGGGNLAGDTEFKNIKVYFGGDLEGTKYKNFCCGGYNVTFGEGCSYAGKPVESTFVIGVSSGDKVFTKDFTIDSRISVRNFYIGPDWNNSVYNCNVTVFYDYGGESPIFNLGTKQGNGITTYNKSLNLIIKNSGTASFIQAGNMKFGDDGYFQILNSGSSKIDQRDSGLDVLPADKLWILNNVSGKNSVINITDTKGVYDVKLDNAEHKLIATNMLTNESVIYDGANGLTGKITLPAGAYIISIDRDPEYRDYYVDSERGVEVISGTRPEGVGTKENPVKTYSDATRLIAADGLAEIDVATIYLPSGTTSHWGSSAVAVKPLIIIDAASEEQALLETGGSVSLGADTVFKNVSFSLGGKWPEFSLNEHSLTIDEKAVLNTSTVYLWSTAYAKKRANDVDIIVKGKFLTTELKLYAPYHSHTSTGDFNIVWDNPDCTLALAFGNHGTDRGAHTPNIYEGNINVTIKQADAFSMKTVGAGAEIKGTFNVMIDDDVRLPYNTKVKFNDFPVEGGKWYITNVAEDIDFATFTKEKGKFAVKNGATAYTRMGEEATVKHVGGTVDLSAAPGEYVISDKKDVEPIIDDPQKMLYYKLGGGNKHIAQRAYPIEDNQTYIFEYTIFSQAYSLTKPIVVEDDRRSVAPVEIISDTLLGKEGTPGANFHRVVAQFTLPEGVNKSEGTSLFVGVSLSPHDEGLILDRTVYKKGDPEKKDLFRGGNMFHDGLDEITLNYEFWGAVFSGSAGGSGRTYWTNGIQELKIMNKDLSYADYLVYLNNPQDGKWWNDDDIVKEEEFETYAKAKGTFKDQDGKGIKGIKFRLASTDHSYEATTNSKGAFNFGVIVTGFYDLYIVDGEEEIHTGFNSYISQDDLIVFNIVSDMSGIVVEDTVNPDDNYGDDYLGDYTGEDTQTSIDGDNVEEIIPSGNLKGTVYTPNLETVKDLKVGLRGVGEAVTDANGVFGFADIPVGDYEIYAINSDGSEYVFRKVTIKENVNLEVKLKYEPSINDTDADGADNGWIIWVIVASVVALVVVGVLIFFLVIKKKKV